MLPLKKYTEIVKTISGSYKAQYEYCGSFCEPHSRSEPHSIQHYTGIFRIKNLSPAPNELYFNLYPTMNQPCLLPFDLSITDQSFLGHQEYLQED